VSLSPSKFAPGQRVRKKAKTFETAEVIAGPVGDPTRPAFRVLVGQSVKIWLAEEMELCTKSSDARSLLLDGTIGDAESCRLFLTLMRASSGLTNYVYSLYNSRTRFFPHQFKPLLKFLEGDRGRILVADEVGLGKTIEAGIILIENEARNKADTVVILCPAKLRNKWQREMLDRFGQDFEVANSSHFSQRMAEFGKGIRNKLRLIVSYETMRSDTCMEVIRELQVPLDLIIADEAHIFRNSSTSTYAGLEELGERAESAVFLSATPVNNKAEDLYNLLHLLDPDTFTSVAGFEQLRRRNRAWVEIENLLRAGLKVDQAKLKAKLAPFAQEGLAAQSLFMDRLNQFASGPPPSSLSQVVVAQRAASQLNLLNRHLVRSRRVDVDEHRARRVAHMVKVTLAPEETELYELCYRVAMKRYASFRFPVLSLERKISSCIPSFVKELADQGPQAAGIFEDEDVDEVGEAPAQLQDLFDDDPEVELRILKLASTIHRSGVDSKFDHLKQILDELEHEQAGRKVIIFSFYRKTIEYLATRLNQEGIKTQFIHGGIPSNPGNPEADERERRVQRFRRDPSARVLVMSEVGAEGLDFQFCHIVVNYDLPWNPMRVEQRIGRIDRIGQESDRLLVYSLVSHDTVDDMIYEYLLVKVGVFRETLGELEEILGTVENQIKDLAFSPNLSKEQQKEQAELAAAAVERHRHEVEVLEEHASDLIGSDYYVLDEIDRIRRTQRFVGPDEIQSFVEALIQKDEIRLVPHQIAPGVFEAELGDSARAFLENRVLKTPESSRLLWRCRRPGARLRWSFDYQLADRTEDCELFNLKHPFVSALIRWVEESKDIIKPTFSCKVRGEAGLALEAGWHLLAVYMVKMDGHRRTRMLLPVALDLEREPGEATVDFDQASLLLSTVIRQAQELPMPEAMTGALGNYMDIADSLASSYVATKKDEQEAEDNLLIRERRAAVAASFERRESSLLRQLDRYNLEGRARLMPMVEGKLKQLGAERERMLSQVPEAVSVSQDLELKAVGIVRVGG
jgi:ERCC4-related helicase